MATELRTDGPHNPDYTREVGNVLAESVRVLNYATLGDAPGLDYPGDAYSLIAAVYTATQRLPQLLGQIASFLESEAASGRLADDHGRDVGDQVDDAAAALREAGDLAEQATRELRDAQNAISGLYVKEEAGD